MAFRVYTVISENIYPTLVLLCWSRY